MQVPIRVMTGNLAWTRHGTVWATWRLRGIPYGLRSIKDKHTARALHTALFRALPGQSVLMGICTRPDPAGIVERMLHGVDLADHPQWAAECEATLATLDELAPGERTYWLSVPLKAARPTDVLTEPARAVLGSLHDWIGLTQAPIPDADVQRRLTQAGQIAAAIPAPFAPTPATPAQRLWLHQHAINRGQLLDPDLPTPEAMPTQRRRFKVGGALTEPILDEAGQSDLPRRRDRFNPLGRQYVKVTDPDCLDPSLAQPSYQSLLVLADLPEAMTFPGSEFIGRVDESGLDVDWIMRLNVLASAKVIAKNRRALTNLNDQFTQREGEVGHGLNSLARIAEDLAEYADLLDRDKLEVEVQATTVFAVAGPTPSSATAQAQSLAGHYAGSHYQLIAPLGRQEDLWWATQPENPPSQIVRRYAQITTSRAMAAAVPLASTQLGDTTGAIIGLDITSGPLFDESSTCGPCPAVCIDLEGAADRNTSGSVAVCGELGAGKTATLMTLAGHIVDRSGQLVIADRTHKMEWASWARAVTNAAVVDVADPQLSLDPLRIFGPRIGARVMQTFLTPLLNVAPTSDLGATLAEVLDPDYLRRHHLTSAGALLSHLGLEVRLPGANAMAHQLTPAYLEVHQLQTAAQLVEHLRAPGCPLPGGTELTRELDGTYLRRHGIETATELVAHLGSGCRAAEAAPLARLINVFARKDLGRVIFDGSIPPLDTTAGALVLCTHGTVLPSRDELSNEHLFRQMGVEKIFGRALYALIAALAREVCFADTSRLAGFVVSEAHAVTISPEAEREVADLDRDGRKHRALVLLDTHDAEEDLGSEVLRGLIPYRLLMRHTDLNLARRGLAFLGIEHIDDDLVDLITKDTSPLIGAEVPLHRRGEGLLRDSGGNIGRLKVLLSSSPERRRAITAGGTAAARATPPRRSSANPPAATPAGGTDRGAA